MFLHTFYDAFDKFAENESTQMFTGSITLRMQRGRNGLVCDYDICHYIGQKYQSKINQKFTFILPIFLCLTHLIQCVITKMMLN